MAKWDKEKILDVLRNLAEQLDTSTLSVKQIAQVVSPSTVNSHFGNLGNALETAGLETSKPGHNFLGRGLEISDEDLFKALFDLEVELGREPGFNDNVANGKFSKKPYSKRFGKWKDVLQHYRKWKLENNRQADSPSGARQSVESISERAIALQDAPATVVTTVKFSPNQLYGGPIDFRGLRHAPINEQGVVFLFALVSKELGFSIESIQTGFPDCEGKFHYDPKKNQWARARIEFEFKAKNFLEHGHNPEQCDFIVCWENNWPESPLPVIELKTEILKLPSR